MIYFRKKVQSMVIINEKNENTNITTIELFPLKFVKNIDDNYCSICLNTIDLHFTKLECCGQNIHERCLVEWIYLQSSIEPKCPICRTLMNSLTTIPVSTFLMYLNSILSDKVVQTNKVKRIVCSLYDDPIVHCFKEVDPDIINTSRNISSNVCTCNNIALTSFVVFVITLVVLLLVNIID